MFSTLKFLAHVVETQRKHGWVSRRTADAEGGTATADRAILSYPSASPPREAYELARGIVAHARAHWLEGDDSRLRMLARAAISPRITLREAASAATIPAVYARELVAAEERAKGAA